MIAIESVHYLCSLKYLSILDYIEDAIFMIRRNQEIYTRIVYIQKGI